LMVLPISMSQDWRLVMMKSAIVLEVWVYGVWISL
jgi:hypothetical protein